MSSQCFTYLPRSQNVFFYSFHSLQQLCNSQLIPHTLKYLRPISYTSVSVENCLLQIAEWKLVSFFNMLSQKILLLFFLHRIQSFIQYFTIYYDVISYQVILYMSIKPINVHTYCIVQGSLTRTGNALSTIIYHILTEITEIMVVQIYMESLHAECLFFPYPQQ